MQIITFITREHTKNSCSYTIPEKKGRLTKANSSLFLLWVAFQGRNSRAPSCPVNSGHSGASKHSAVLAPGSTPDRLNFFLTFCDISQILSSSSVPRVLMGSTQSQSRAISSAQLRHFFHAPISLTSSHRPEIPAFPPSKYLHFKLGFFSHFCLSGGS